MCAVVLQLVAASLTASSHSQTSHKVLNIPDWYYLHTPHKTFRLSRDDRRHRGDYTAKRLKLSRKKLEVLWVDCLSVSDSLWKPLSSLKRVQRPQTHKHAQQELHAFNNMRIRVDTRATWSNTLRLSLYSTVTHLFSVLAVGLHVNIKAANMI